MKYCFGKNWTTKLVESQQLEENPFPIVDIMQRTVWWNFQQKNIQIYPRRKESQGEEELKLF
jgi:hypothetical protein